MIFSSVASRASLTSTFLSLNSQVLSLPGKARAALNSTRIQTPVGLKSWTLQTPRCCTYLPQLHTALIAAASSSPQTQQPHGKEQEKCPVCPRIYSRVLLGYLYFIDPSRRKDRAFPLQSLSSFPTFFLFFFKGS